MVEFLFPKILSHSSLCVEWVLRWKCTTSRELKTKILAVSPVMDNLSCWTENVRKNLLTFSEWDKTHGYQPMWISKTHGYQPMWIFQTHGYQPMWSYQNSWLSTHVNIKSHGYQPMWLDLITFENYKNALFLENIGQNCLYANSPRLHWPNII